MRRRAAWLAGLVLLGSCNGQQSDLAGDAGRFTVSAVGRVDSAEEARQLVASVDGVIAGVHVRRGQAVRAGDRLMSIDCRVRGSAAEAALAQSREAMARSRLIAQGARAEDWARGEALLAAAQARQADAQDRLARAEALIEQGFITKREIVTLRNAAAEAGGEVSARKAELDLLHNGARPDELRQAEAASAAAGAQARSAQEASDQCDLLSPIDGQVLQILRRQGEFSGAFQGQPLVIVGDTGKLIVRAEINERDAASIKVGQQVEIWTDWGGQHWRGRVVELASVMGRRSARSLDPSDRFDRDVREALIAVASPAPPALVGLRVTVGFRE